MISGKILEVICRKGGSLVVGVLFLYVGVSSHRTVLLKNEAWSSGEVA